jgi:hypothetical protein
MLLAGFVPLLQVTFFALLEDFYPGRLAVKDWDKTQRITGVILIMSSQIYAPKSSTRNIWNDSRIWITQRKNRQGDSSGYEATRRKQRRQHRARSEETTSPRGGPDQIYNERIRDSRHLGEITLARQIYSRVSKIRLFSHKL